VSPRKKGRGHLINRLLIVDNEPDILKLASFFLRKNGYEILIATNGEMAIAIAKESKPNLILLDIKMPDIGGHEVFRRIREEQGLAKVPIIFMTADTDFHLFKNTKFPGNVSFLMKPFKMTALLSKIKQYE